MFVCCLQQAVKGKTGRKERESGGEAAILAVAVSTGSQLPASIRSSPPPADHPPTIRLPGAGGSREQPKSNSPNCCPILKSGSSHGCPVSLVSDLHRWRRNAGARRLSLLLGDDELNWDFRPCGKVSFLQIRENMLHQQLSALALYDH